MTKSDNLEELEPNVVITDEIPEEESQNSEKDGIRFIIDDDPPDCKINEVVQSDAEADSNKDISKPGTLKAHFNSEKGKRLIYVLIAFLALGLPVLIFELTLGAPRDKDDKASTSQEVSTTSNEPLDILDETTFGQDAESEPGVTEAPISTPNARNY